MNAIARRSSFPTTQHRGRKVVRLVPVAILCVTLGCRPRTSDAVVAACGGPLLGAWSIRTSRLDRREMATRHGSVETDLTHLELTGTWTFRDDGTYEVEMRATGDWVVSGSPGAASSCRAIEDRLRALFAGPHGEAVDLRCSGATACRCVHHLDARPLRAAGRYERKATSVALGRANSLDYCVLGDELTLQATPGRGALGDDRDVTGRLYLTRVVPSR